MSVNRSDAGQAFYNSLYEQYASWGVDYIKNDCVFGVNFESDQIQMVHDAIDNSGKEMVYSLSPGDTSHIPQEIDNAKKIHKWVNLYRVSDDDWDQWAHVNIHFSIAQQFLQAGLIGSSGNSNSENKISKIFLGSHGLSWPDLDMLPFGWISDPGSTQGPYHWSYLTHDEQYTQMTLWLFLRISFLKQY